MSVHNWSTAASSNVSVDDGVGAVSVAEGMSRGSVNNAMRGIMADVKKLYNDLGSKTTTGTGAAYLVSLDSNYTAYFAGMIFAVKVHATSSDNATISVNGLGAKNIKVKGDGALQNLKATEFVAGEIVILIYDGSAFVALGHEAFDVALQRHLEADNPVGTVRIFTVSAVPAELALGRTWVATAEGRAIVGVGTADGETWTNGQQKGAATHTLTESEIAAHTHGVGTYSISSDGAHTHGSGSLATASNGAHSHTWSINQQNNTSTGGHATRATNAQVGSSGDSSANTTSDGNHTHNITGSTASNGSHTHTLSGSSASAGGGGAHNNIQPSQAFYVFERTA